MSLESETDDGGAWLKRIRPAPSTYIHPQLTIGSSSGSIGVIPVTQLSSIEPFHLKSVDVSLFPTRFILSVRQTGETDVEEVSASWLPEALEELDAAKKDAEEEGYEPVTELIVENARKLLNDLARRVVHSPIVQSMPEGGIAIEFRNPEKRAGVVVVCEPDGEGACFYEVEGRRSRTRCTDINDLLDAAVWYALSEAALT